MECLICLEDHAVVSQLDAHDACGACQARAAVAPPGTPPLSLVHSQAGGPYRCAACGHRCAAWDVFSTYPRPLCLTCGWDRAYRPQAA